MKGGEKLGIRDYLGRKLYKRSKHYEMGSAILNGYYTLGDENILNSSEVYHYMTAISNMFACGRWVVEDQNGVEIEDPVLKKLNFPNGYLTGFEFKKLIANLYLIHGEVFIIKDGDSLHTVRGLEPSINKNAEKQFKYDGHILTRKEVAQVKNVGLYHNEGIGLINLSKETLEGVMNAEKAITDKYKKGGLLAYLLELETHLSPKNTLQNEMVEAIQNKLSEISDEGKTVIIPLSKGYKIKGFESPVDDEKLLKYLSVYKPDLAKYYGFDPDVYSGLLKNDLEEGATYLKGFAVDSWLENVCEHLTVLFFGEKMDKKINLLIDMNKYLTMTKKIKNVSGLIRTMAATPDEGRKLLGQQALNTHESTQLYASKDLIGLDDLADLNKSKMKKKEGEENEEDG